MVAVWMRRLALVKLCLCQKVRFNLSDTLLDVAVKCFRRLSGMKNLRPIRVVM